VIAIWVAAALAAEVDAELGLGVSGGSDPLQIGRLTGGGVAEADGALRVEASSLVLDLDGGTELAATPKRIDPRYYGSIEGSGRVGGRQRYLDVRIGMQGDSLVRDHILTPPRKLFEATGALDLEAGVQSDRGFRSASLYGLADTTAAGSEGQIYAVSRHGVVGARGRLKYVNADARIEAVHTDVQPFFVGRVGGGDSGFAAFTVGPRSSGTDIYTFTMRAGLAGAWGTDQVVWPELDLSCHWTAGWLTMEARIGYHLSVPWWAAIQSEYFYERAFTAYIPGVNVFAEGRGRFGIREFEPSSDIDSFESQAYGVGALTFGQDRGPWRLSASLQIRHTDGSSFAQDGPGTRDTQDVQAGVRVAFRPGR